MDTRQVIARFEAERQALALMDHPNIAKVLDAGTTGTVRQALPDSPLSSLSPDPCPLTPGTGRPYFVMELVQGVPITEYCDQCNLTTRERLALFATVCQAVQHAHQKGVIHRDIKPTNILVAIQDGQATPKVIDFGVAKAINQQLTEHTLATGFAQIIGTPLYMSPEQAELSPLGVDTRSDIYSLGVLLYELLTGTTPFDKDRLHSVSYDELRRIIREEEPPRPSARVSTLAADLADTVAEHRRTDARRLRQTVHGELDWIVMKCLEKDRNRRYETAGSLARDIERYLHDEPVQACPPSAVYRLKKFVRRNRIAAAFILLLVAAVAGLTVSNIRTSLSERRANTQNRRAQEISKLLQGMLRSANPDEAKDAEYTVRQLLDDFSADFGEGLPGEPEVEAEIRATIGRTYRGLGASELAEPHLKRAIELGREVYGPKHEKLAAILLDYGWNLEHQRRFKEAEPYLREALQIYRESGITGTEYFHALRVLQDLLISSRRDAEAEEVTRQGMELARESSEEFADFASMLHQYADLKNKQGHFAKAEELSRRAVEMHRRVHGEHRDTAHALEKLATALKAQNKLDEAEKALSERLAIFRRFFPSDHVQLRNARQQLKSVIEARGDLARVDALAKEEADEAMRADATGHHVRLAGLLLSNLPPDITGTEMEEEAHRLLRWAIDAYGKVAAKYPNDLDRRLKALDGYLAIINLCAGRNAARELDETYRNLTAELEALLAHFPDSTSCQEKVGHRYRQAAFAVQNIGNYSSQAEHAHRQAIKLFEPFLKTKPNSPVVWGCLANSYLNLGDIQRRSGQAEVAETAFGRALAIYDEHAAEIAMNSTESGFEMTAEYFRLVGLLQKNKPQKGGENSHRFIRAVMDGYRQVATNYPGDLNRRATALDGCAQAIWHCAVTPGFASELEELNRRLEAEVPKLLAAFPDSGDCLWRTANIYRRWAVTSTWDKASLPTAERAIRESIKLHEKLSLAEPKRPGVWLYLADRNIVLGYMLWRSGRPDDAEAAYRRAIETFDQHEADIAADKSDSAPLTIVIDSVWLADFLGCTDRGDEAAKFIHKAVLNAKRLTKPFELALAHYHIALLQARLGDVARYRETCKALVDVPVDNADDFTKARTILTWCHLSGAIEDLSLPVNRARELAAHNSIDQPHIVPYVLGAALYRAGKYEVAEKSLEESVTLYPSDPQPGDRIINWQRLFLAMAKWQQGQRDEGRQLLAEIQPAIDEELRSTTTPMNYRVTLEVLRREAEALIEKNKDEATEKPLNAKP
jgi:serine/threonine protein kinase/Tfp pilus assembly protein PilF